MYIEEVGSTRGVSLCSGSNISNKLSSQKKIYYYSKFDLFEQKQEGVIFAKYKTFLKKLIMHLGDDWRIQANLALKPNQIGYKEFFEWCLQIWLEINKMKKNKQIKQEDVNLDYDNVYFELFLSKLLLKIYQYKSVDKNCLRQLAMGFFFSANQIWRQLSESKQQTFVKKGVFGKISQKIQNQSLFNPLMVAKQKIFTFFNKKVKVNQSSLSPSQINSFSKFKENFKEDQIQHKLKRLTLNQDDFDQKEEPLSKKRCRQQETSEVTFEKIPEQNPINQNLLQSAYSYIQSLINKKDKWQVARGFVTNILQINYNKIQEKFTTKKDNSNNKNEQINVRVLKPASDFYHNLMVVWLLFKNDSEYRMKFKQYLQRVKNIFGASWRQNYLQATKLFFLNLGNEWNKLIQQNNILKKPDEQIIEIFVERVRENMQKEWEQKIIRKEGDFSKKIIGTSL